MLKATVVRCHTESENLSLRFGISRSGHGKETAPLAIWQTFEPETVSPARPESERGDVPVAVSYGDIEDSDLTDPLLRVSFDGSCFRICTKSRNFEVDISGIEAAQIEEAVDAFGALNASGLFELKLDGHPPQVFETAAEIANALGLWQGRFPREALEAALRRREEVVPVLLSELASYCAEPALMLEETRIGHMVFPVLLAEFGATEALPLLVRMVGADSELVDEAFDFYLTEDLAGVMASLSTGEPGPFVELAMNPRVNEYVRSAAVRSLLFVAGNGLLATEAASDCIRRIFAEIEDGCPDTVVSHLVEAIAVLKLQDLHQSVLDLIDGNRVDPWMMDREVYQEVLQNHSLASFLQRRFRPMADDPVEELSRLLQWDPLPCVESAVRFDEEVEGLPDEFFEPYLKRDAVAPVSIVRSEPKVGRNDPCPCGSGRKHKRCCLDKR